MTEPSIATSVSVAPRARWLALDALRGLTIAAMILVNNPGDWGHVYAPLRHASWHGCTLADLVFPGFLFAVGAAIVPALSRAIARGRTRAELVRRVVQRALVLVLLGLGLSAFPFVTFADGKSLFDPTLGVRIPGVLQRIGVCYALAALLFLFTSTRTQTRVLIACLAIYWPLLGLCPTPDGGAPDWNSTSDHLAGWLDRTVFGSHVWASTRGQYDPEGLLSTIPALATTLIGVVMGRVLASERTSEQKLIALLLRGVLLVAGGAVWAWCFPLNKPLWTSSYAVFTAGVATCGLGIAYWAFEMKPWARFARPLEIYGVNALLVFVGSGILARIVGRLLTVTDASGAELPLQRWFYRATLSNLGDPYLASLLYAALWVALWFAVLCALWRRGIVWKV